MKEDTKKFDEEFDEFVKGMERILSEGTLKQYRSQFNIIKATFPDTKLKEVPNSTLLKYIDTAKSKSGKDLTINTKKNLLNILVMVKKQVSHEEYVELYEAREAMRDDVKTDMKIKHESMDLSQVPSYEKLRSYMTKQTKHSFIVNYLIFHYNVRNKDLNLKIDRYDRDTGIPDESNWLLIGPAPTLTYVRNDFKTKKAHGQLVYDINSAKLYNFVTELYDREEYNLLRTKQIDQEIRSYTLNNMGEAEILKIIVHHNLLKNSYESIFEISKRRGTAVKTLLSNYNWKYINIDMPEDSI